MGRRPKFSADQIVDAAEEIVSADGPAAATVAAISDRLGAPSGSIYHRFASRDLILAHLWLRTVRRAQNGFIDALADGTIDAAVAAALHIPRWSRANFAQARILILHRREDLAQRWPDELGHDLDRLNDSIGKALRSFARAHYATAGRTALEPVVFALVDVPYGAVRRHLVAGTPPPETIDPLIERVVREVLGRNGSTK